MLPGRPHRHRGFTLLELIVALMLTAILVVSLFGSLRVGFKAQQVAERRVAPGRTAEQVMEVLRTDLQCALPPRGQMTLAQQYLQGTSATGGTHIFAGPFEGVDQQDARGNDGDDLVFFSTAASPLHPDGANGDIKQIEYTVVQAPNSTDFMLVRNTTNNLLDPQPELPDQEVLCRHVYGFNLRYWDGTQWEDNFDSTQQSGVLINTLPIAIEVTLSLDTQEKNADGTPHILQFRRVFGFPCYGQPNDSTTGTPTSTSGGAL